MVFTTFYPWDLTSHVPSWSVFVLVCNLLWSSNLHQLVFWWWSANYPLLRSARTINLHLKVMGKCSGNCKILGRKLQVKSLLLFQFNKCSVKVPTPKILLQKYRMAMSPLPPQTGLKRMDVTGIHWSYFIFLVHPLPSFSKFQYLLMQRRWDQDSKCKVLPKIVS